MRTSFRHQSEAQPPNGPLTAAASPDTPSHMPSHAVFKPDGTSSHLAGPTVFRRGLQDGPRATRGASQRRAARQVGSP
jgi:hypothetical protein